MNRHVAFGLVGLLLIIAGLVAWSYRHPSEVMVGNDQVNEMAFITAGHDDVEARGPTDVELRSEIAHALRIDMSDAAIEAFALRRFPDALAPEKLRQKNDAMDQLADALDAVLGGEEPDVSYRRHGLKQFGIGAENWGFLIENALNEEFIASLRSNASQSQTQFVAETVRSPAVRKIYLEDRVARAVCDLDDGADISHECQVKAREWTQEFVAKKYLGAMAEMPLFDWIDQQDRAIRGTATD